jgi:hypothetical protein
MNQYAKAALLSLMAWHIYSDAVARREESLAGVEHARMMLVLEEGNKIVTGVEASQGDGPPIQSEIWPSVFRDARKYHIDLGIILQSPAEMPPGVLSSCNNLAVGQLKSPGDVEVVMSAMARSSKGFQDIDFRRWIGRAAQAKFMLKLGLEQDERELEPMCYQPLMIAAHEPSSVELRQRYRQRF